MVVRAPATSANLGPGFDCAGVALSLWNELRIADGEGVEIGGIGARELPAGHTNLAVRAYALLADPAGKRFIFVNRIPLGSGLGSSAAAIALGLVAARPDGNAEELFAAGLELESHGDNLAAALVGGVTLTWERRIEQIAHDLPVAVVAVIPPGRTSTAASRTSLPEHVPHVDAARTAGRAALLGAAIASGRADILADALDDRLHEPYRLSPTLAAVRERLPAGAVGATLSGSGPSVLVWTTDPTSAVADLRIRFPTHDVWHAAVTPKGALGSVTTSESCA